ncbi:Polysaccharide deacetylase [Caldisalinibacter kiritimatiensis]|uniref:Polysaccharide deacetylase n=2 Tax=Caldisalinibacter kiritimatiensis TaxID=1304284 RepID=R1CVB1_9FIRM|nr:Polysaccharide deacetylase [Caldisalinibacter kiritimatiensis]
MLKQTTEAMSQNIIEENKINEVEKNEHSIQQLQNISNSSIIDTQIPILMYHHISENPEKWNYSTISPLKFKEDMLYLKVLNYNTINFLDYINFEQNGIPLPENPIIITFDDGYLSNYKYVYPILKQLDMKATISIVGWSVGRKYHKDGATPIKEHFTWEQAKEMYDSGVIDIQHHTFDLHNSGDDITCGKGIDKMTDENIQDYRQRITGDIVKLKNLIEKKVGNEVIVFTYPYGIYNDISEELIKELGFKVSLTVEDGVSDFSNGLYLLKRINMSHYEPSVKLMKKILRLDRRNEQVPFEDIKNQRERIRKLEQLLELQVD